MKPARATLCAILTTTRRGKEGVKGNNTVKTPKANRLKKRKSSFALVLRKYLRTAGE